MLDYGQATIYDLTTGKPLAHVAIEFDYLGVLLGVGIAADAYDLTGKPYKASQHADVIIVRQRCHSPSVAVILE